MKMNREDIHYSNVSVTANLQADVQKEIGKIIKEDRGYYTLAIYHMLIGNILLMYGRSLAATGPKLYEMDYWDSYNEQYDIMLKIMNSDGIEFVIDEWQSTIIKPSLKL